MNNIRSTYERKSILINFAVVIAVTLVVYQVRYGLGILIPTEVAWLMDYDWATHFLGWHFYRNEPWTFPLGDIQNYFYPLGTNVVFTDSIPLAAIFFKVFAPILPEHFQYFGLWLVICHMLAAFFLLKILDRFAVTGILQLLACLIITFNPVLLQRSFHPALCAHWLLLASIWIYFLDNKVSASRKMAYQLGIVVLAALINPYLAIMVTGFLLTTLCRFCFFDRSLSMGKTTMWLAGSLVVLFLTWYVVGAFVFKSTGDLGISGAYGLYGFNLNSLFNPNGFSSVLSARPNATWHQFESFFYLGLGMLLLCIATVVFGAVRFLRQRFDMHRLRAAIPLFIFATLCAAFAITNVVSFDEFILFKVPIPGVLAQGGDVFRASARFFWIPYYLILIGTLIYWNRTISNRQLTLGLFVLIFSIQIADYYKLFKDQHVKLGEYRTPLNESFWKRMIGNCDQIVFYPPLTTGYESDQDYRFFAYLAAEQRKPINIGYVARQDNVAAGIYVRQIEDDLSNEEFGGRTLYVTTSPFLERFKVLFQSGALECERVDGYFALYSKEVSSTSRDTLLPLSFTTKQKFEKLTLQPKEQNDSITSGIDKILASRDYISIEGWAFLPRKKDPSHDDVFVVLKSGDQTFAGRTYCNFRPDISPYFKNPNLDSVGFHGVIFTDLILPGDYQLGLYIVKQGARSGAYKYLRNVTVGSPINPRFEPMREATSMFEMNIGIDKFEDNERRLRIGGWANLVNKDFGNSTIRIVLKDSLRMFVAPVVKVKRPDVATHFNNKFDLENCGFDADISKRSIPPGTYQVGIAIFGPAGDKTYVYFTDKICTKSEGQ